MGYILVFWGICLPLCIFGILVGELYEAKDGLCLTGVKRLVFLLIGIFIVLAYWGDLTGTCANWWFKKN